MTKYIKGKDGKFAGSIGDGKSNVPTPSSQPQGVKRKCDNCGATTQDWTMRRWDSGDVEAYCAACLAAENALSSQNKAWARFQEKRAATPSVPAKSNWLANRTDFIEGTISTEHGDSYYMDTREYATRVLPLESETGAIEWEATIAFADRQFGEDGFPEGSIESIFMEKTFADKEEAGKWAEEHAHRIHQERTDFQAAHERDPYFMDERAFRVPEYEEISDIPTGMITMNCGKRTATLNFGATPSTVDIREDGQPYHYAELEDPLEALAFTRYLMIAGK